MKIKYLFICLLIAFLETTPISGQWITQSPLPTGQSLRSVKFINNEVGWFVGNNGVIIKTTDSGESWIIQRNNIPNALWSVSFIDENNGWVVGYDVQNYGGMILHTTNGGEVWSNQNMFISGIVN